VIEPMNCPFCGSSDVGASGGQVHCYHCPVILEVQNTNTFYAVELWNRRSARSEITSLKARLADLVTALQDAVNIIQADANTEENYGSLCRMGSVLAFSNSDALILRKQAEELDIEAAGFELAGNEVMSGRYVATALRHAASKRRDEAGGGDE